MMYNSPSLSNRILEGIGDNYQHHIVPLIRQTRCSSANSSPFRSPDKELNVSNCQTTEGSSGSAAKNVQATQLSDTAVAEEHDSETGSCDHNYGTRQPSAEPPTPPPPSGDPTIVREIVNKLLTDDLYLS